MSETSQLLAHIETYLTETGMAATTFGQKAVKNWKVVDRLRNGGSVTLKQAERIREFIEANPPRREERVA